MALFDYFRRRSPLAPAAPDSEIEPAITDAPPMQERRQHPRRAVPVGTQVLIVDDSKTMVAALGAMLRDNHFTVLEAHDGETAIDLLRKNVPSLIFLDLVLPGISGFDVLRRIRRSQYVGKVPVIAMSGNEAATEEYYVRRIGADDFMRKPCSRAEVYMRVERTLSLEPNALGGADATNWLSDGNTRLEF